MAALVSDPKVQNKVLAASIEAGEVYALASLTSERFVLRAAGIPSADIPKYIGRGQYPRFQKQSPFSPQNDAEPDKTYFTCIHNIVNKTKLFKSQNTTCIPHSIAVIIQAWTSTYVANIIKHNQVDPNRDPDAKPITICGLTIAQWKIINNEFHVWFQFHRSVIQSKLIELLDVHCAFVVHEFSKQKSAAFAEWVNSQFAPKASAADLFRYIDKEKQQALTVDMTKIACESLIDPFSQINSVLDKWTPVWAPSLTHDQEQIRIASAID